MNWFLILLVTCVALAVLKVAVVVLLIVLSIAALWGVWKHPSQTMSLLAFVLFMHVLATNPAVILALFVLLIVLCAIVRP